VLRLLRLLRTLRMVKHFSNMWKLVTDFVSSFSAMFSTVSLIIVTLYMASCFAVEMISKDTLLRSVPETRSIIDTYFSSLDVVMLSFLQFVTMDSIAAIYFPLIRRRGYLSIFFIVLIVVVSVTLMNLVTAHLVEAAIANTMKDTEMEEEAIRRLRPAINKAFELMDENNDKTLTRAEVATCTSMLPPVILKSVPDNRLLELFDILDLDDSGTVSQDEFVEGIEQLALHKITFAHLQVLRFLTQIRGRMEQHRREVLDVQGQLMCLQDRSRNILRPNQSSPMTSEWV